MKSKSPKEPASDNLSFLNGGGEMGERIRAFDWTSTPLGPPRHWPRSLKTIVRVMLTSQQPIWIGWGKELIKLYNDPYKPIIGGKHPRMLGQPASVVWKEIWEHIAPQLETAMTGVEGTYVEAQLLIMERNGYPEETYYTYSYTGVPDDDGKVGGIICANTDGTQRVIGERQLALLRDLAGAILDLRHWREVCERAAAALTSNPRDLPFAMIYTVGLDGKSAALQGVSGVEKGHPVAPATIALDAPSPWPLAEVLQSHAPRVVSDLGSSFKDLPTGAWHKPPQQAVILPIAAAGAANRTGALIVGLNPYRLYDEGYNGFLSLATGQIAAAIATADAYEYEKKRAEELAELDRAKTQFFSNVSHEFRTPLTLMLGPLEDALANAHGILPLGASKDLSVSHRNALRLLKLVNTLLDFSRIESGRIQANYEPTDLATLTSDLASNFRSACEKAGLRLIVDCWSLRGAEPVYVDRDMWEKIVLNLLSNAFKFTLNGQIEVRLDAIDKHARLTVRDTGVGIPAGELPHIFKRFHRVKESRGRTHEGTGIGLALVQELVSLHGGEVRVESPLGEGSTFTVTIPLSKAHLDPERIGKPSELVSTGTASAAFVEEALRWLPGSDRRGEGEGTIDPMLGERDRVDGPRGPQIQHVGNARILWADDNADMREYVERLLKQSGRFKVEAVPDGQAALAAARANPPALVLADVMMPNLDGFGLLREMRADPRLREIPVILVSARAGEESRIEGMLAGADDYLTKPFSARELLARAESHVKMAEFRRQATAALRESEERFRHLAESERAARADAEEAGRVKDEFLAMLSHELRTPLNAILGWSQLMAKKPGDADTVNEGLQIIISNARAQAGLIADLLDMSRIVSGKLRLEVEHVDLSDIISAAIDSVRHRAEAKGIRIQSVLSPQSDTVRGDAGRLQQVIWNLLCNAIKFTPKGGSIQITFAKKDSHAEIVVSDTGVGIKPEFLPHLFERFRQADASASRGHGGLGLGLAIVKHLVELHGGTVRAESAGEGQGATFTVALPISLTHAPLEDKPRQRAKECGEAGLTLGEDLELAGVTALAVDDHPDTCDLLKRLLEERHAQVITAGSADEALELLKKHRPHVVLCDVGMPGKDGYEFIKEVRKQGDNTPALAVTAFARTEDRLRALRAGYQGHVQKPVEPAELIATVAVFARTGPSSQLDANRR